MPTNCRKKKSSTKKSIDDKLSGAQWKFTQKLLLEVREVNKQRGTAKSENFQGLKKKMKTMRMDPTREYSILLFFKCNKIFISQML